MSNNPTQSPDNNDDIFKRDIFEVIYPMRANNKIWNKKDFNIEILGYRGDRKIILILKKEDEKE